MPSACATHLLPVALLAVALAVAKPAANAASADPDWPCIQRKMPEISAGMVWTGPAVDEVGTTWFGDQSIAELARRVASRRTGLDEAKQLIKQFADASGADKNTRLTTLFAGVLSTINSERASIMAGIGRYAKRQHRLAEKIEQQTAELDSLPAENSSERADLLEVQDWDARIFQEREWALTYVCEQPVLLEKRAFELGRSIAAHLDK